MNKVLSLGLLSATLPLLSQGVAHAISLNFSTNPAVEVGRQIDVEVIISDLGDGSALSLGAYDFDINFDDSILDFNSAVFGDAVLGNQLDILGFGSINEVIESSDSTVNILELSLDSDIDLDTFQADSFTLATLTFDTVGVGTGNLEFDNLILGDALGDPLTVTANSGSVTVEPSTSVPEASTTLGLLALGIIGLRLKHNRKC